MFENFGRPDLGDSRLCLTFPGLCMPLPMNPRTAKMKTVDYRIRRESFD
jgi:hypothetical protein